jgi:DNA-binding transcriptional regulator YiaG
VHRFWVQGVTAFIFVRMTKSVFSKEYSLFLSVLISMREETGLSQRGLSKKLKKVATYVSKYERGERRLDLIEFLEIAKALKADPCDVINKLR